MQVDFILEQRRRTIEGFTKGMRLTPNLALATSQFRIGFLEY